MHNNSTIYKIINLSWSLIGLIIIMASIGFAMLYSAAEGSFHPWASKQIIRFVALFPFMILIAIIDIKIWFKASYVIYFLVLMSLVFTELFGSSAMGATRWISIGPFNIQPSEVMKVCLVFALARYFHATSPMNIGRITYLIPPLIMVALPSVLILKQPDLGTTFILIAVAGVVFFVAGVKMWKFIALGVGGVALAPFIWMHMHDYQKKRVTSFLNPEGDPMGAGYNILQSKIAIGSGGVSGKGFLQGTQSQLSFLPEKQTDFIFTMLTEEFGFIGGITVITLYAIIIAYGIFIAAMSKNIYGRLMAIGITGILFFHVFINIAMVMGLIPVVGAPLPLLSYGGTIMMTILVSFGLLLNVSLHSEETFNR
ncbi:MAG: rod shape-determining protein RodA [Rickettsiales bacterium]|nr:rod shape-determining protein RodA [Rickettsiales bacterium]MDG4545548.1 rod shape-determining protein RodA [Rickettsiales bacterium]MDG4547997.1 rod shape-determining protein RodA [Rickettsiales bacterium]